jgi:hypothetical protein
VNENRDAPHTFLQKKKGKKESRLALWRVSKKQVLRIKYYPTEEVLSGQFTVVSEVEC